MESWSPTIAASNARRVLRYGASRGVELRAGELTSARARVPAQHMFSIWEQLGAALDRALPIQLAQRSSLEDLQLLGFVITSAPTLRQGLEAFVRYGALLSEAFVWSLAVEPRSFEIRWHCRVPIGPGVRLALETSLAQVVQGIRQLAGADVDPTRVELAHAAPARAAEHRAFFRCPVQFEATRYCLSFPRHVLEAVPPHGNRALFEYLCGQAELALAELAPQPLAARVRSGVARELSSGRVPRLPALARELGASTRSLRRQLAADSLRFRDLVDDARRAQAQQLLAQSHLSVSRVAFELGFANASAFAHACQRWFGVAPGELRRCPR
ncbi:MAG TPA: AraC family transcriptional regulator ligand-binding domain-containing protein [Polyangiales bacterium]|nr:AraC family transcriptional regulator ligand-binding domain-containing protein [Polyangiales bacterium]